MTPEAFFADAFFASLEADFGRAATPGLHASGVLGKLWGLDLPRSLARFVDGLAGAAREVVRRPFFAHETWDWLPPSLDDACMFMLAEWYRRCAMLTGTIAIGGNGDGDIWLAEVHRERTRVALLNHDTMTVSVVADSIESFALLVTLSQSGGDWSPLNGRVRSGGTFEAPGGLVELPPEAGADLAARADAVDELLGCLWYGHEPRPAPATQGADAASLLERMLRTYLRGEDAVPGGEGALRDHPAHLVRSAARLLARHQAARDRTERWRLLETG